MPSLSSTLIGIIVALLLALGIGGWVLKGQIERRAVAEQALTIAVKVNADNVAAMAAAKAEAAQERDRAIARQRERDGMAASVAALRQALGDSLGACKWTDEQAKALDDFGVKP